MMCWWHDHAQSSELFFSLKKNKTKQKNKYKQTKPINLKPPTQTCKNHLLGLDDKQSSGHTDWTDQQVSG